MLMVPLTAGLFLMLSVSVLIGVGMSSCLLAPALFMLVQLQHVTWTVCQLRSQPGCGI